MRPAVVLPRNSWSSVRVWLLSIAPRVKKNPPPFARRRMKPSSRWSMGSAVVVTPGSALATALSWRSTIARLPRVTTTKAESCV